MRCLLRLAIGIRRRCRVQIESYFQSRSQVHPLGTREPLVTNFHERYTSMRSKIVLKSLAAAIVIIGLLMISVPASGHHGTGISYDLTKMGESKGVIVSFSFRNPHAQHYWDVKDEKG